MRIISIKHPSYQPREHLEILARALKHTPDIVLGADQSLHDKDKESTHFRFYEEADKILLGLSLAYPKTLIVPGTLPKLRKRVMTIVAPVYINGKKIAEFEKETDINESELAKSQGLTYKRGKSEFNKLYFQGRKIAVEICSDHGKQRIDKDTFLELIPAYDLNAGFYVRSGSDDFARFAVFCDGQQPVTGCRFFNPAHTPKQGIIQGTELEEFLKEYELNEANVRFA